MKALSLIEIADAVDGEINNKVELTIDSISTDTRQLESGDLFIALIGENFDAHDFLEQAFAKGAKAAVVSADKDYSIDQPLIKVEDTTRALQDLAAYYLQQFSLPVIAVTGSTGKTTTKDLIASVVGQKYKTLKTQGNFNNEIGLPLTLFRLDESYEAVVLEMGMRGLGEIDQLTEIAPPDIGVVTNVGKTHIELLGSIDNIAQAKSELVQSLDSTGVAILNADDQRVKNMAQLTTADIIYYGIEAKADLKGGNIKTLAQQDQVFFELFGAGEKTEVILPMPGEYNVYNALAAAAVGLELRLDLEQIQVGLSNASLTEKRNQILSTAAGIKIINDTYNANPTSVRAGLKTLSQISEQRKIAVLGDMLELGTVAEDEHYKLGAVVAAEGIDYLITIGDLAAEIARGAEDNGVDKSKIFTYNNKENLVVKLKNIMKADDTILVKASRGMKLEEIVESIS
ncbi:UDP-N-acetylmuramoyl-tripeptide--D-alanyl-D-alanine ligase [Halanaerobacter jeridensis]|uniref:UDP-N-acetylmuramoyl-tripeptide--D-alanyl-D-alanine ligase n=1 Tax=Halanaerobacter jeridensis TaxID=706427 RepID=A0A938XQE3_9FIRM|nr:UDP-N-acetylmuramoyl-tripeptide--D-alanyl-D-alanine ligase [Halanaerobacter jeridensis]